VAIFALCNEKRKRHARGGTRRPKADHLPRTGGTGLHARERHRRAGDAVAIPRQAGRPLLLSQGRHAREL